MKEQKPLLSLVCLIPFIFGKVAQRKILLGKKSFAERLCNYVLDMANYVNAPQNSAIDLLLQICLLL